MELFRRPLRFAGWKGLRFAAVASSCCSHIKVVPTTPDARQASEPMLALCSSRPVTLKLRPENHPGDRMAPAWIMR